MGQEPDEIRQQIEDTRARMGETVEAIGYKVDVPARAKESVANAKESVVDGVRGAKDRVVEAVVGARDGVSDAASTFAGAGRSGVARVGDATPSAADVSQQARRAVGVAQENPLGLAIGAFAAGFLAGMVTPTTRIEDERIGPVADQMRDVVRATGQEAIERGKQVAQESAQVVQEAAQEVVQRVTEETRTTVQQQGDELASSAQQNLSQVADEVRRQGATGSVAPEETATSGSDIGGTGQFGGTSGVSGSGFTTS